LERARKQRRKREREGEFPLSEQDKQDIERTINTTSYKHGRVRKRDKRDRLGARTTSKRNRERKRGARSREQRRKREVINSWR
jgi:hypothetical protein